MNEILTKSISTYVGLVLMFFGFIVCVMGFGDAVNAGWGTTFAIRGFSELLFGISFILLGIGLNTFARDRRYAVMFGLSHLRALISHMGCL